MYPVLGSCARLRALLPQEALDAADADLAHREVLEELQHQIAELALVDVLR